MKEPILDLMGLLLPLPLPLQPLSPLSLLLPVLLPLLLPREAMLREGETRAVAAPEGGRWGGGARGKLFQAQSARFTRFAWRGGLRRLGRQRKERRGGDGFLKRHEAERERGENAADAGWPTGEVHSLLSKTRSVPAEREKGCNQQEQGVISYICEPGAGEPDNGAPIDREACSRIFFIPPPPPLFPGNETT